ncbi:MAG: DUF948 domain-containing protein [Gammaproteobacteria bacterium]|nr:DUF948 domain-containing protein [Gammaproteobacteria bacterium]
MSDKVIRMDKQEASKNKDIVIEGDAMARFANAFEASARRWELIIYPTMLAFVVLAAYGFFLIYTLSKDINTLARGMDPEMGKHLSHISESVIYLSENIRTMTRRVHDMSVSVDDMASKMDELDHLEPMLVNMQGMNASMAGMNRHMQNMTLTGDAMRGEMGRMGNSMRPLNFMNNFVPW